MTDDIDVEAMLEAPFKQGEENKENGKESSKKSSRHSSSRHRSRDRSRDRKKKRHRSRSRSRDRSRSHRRRHSSRDRDRSRRRSRSRERRRSRSRSRERRERDRPPVVEEPVVPKERSPSPPDRDARTVFCMQLSQRIRSRDLEDFFSAVGTVRDVKLIADKHSKRSKGIAYVEFKEMESVPLALGLSGQKLLGVPMIVQPSQAEKNRVAAAAASNLQRAAMGPTKLYVSELHQNITEEMLKGIFSPFGRIETVQLIKQQGTDNSSGSGFITFHDSDSAKKALDQLDGFEIAGKAMKVTSITDPSINPQFAFAMLGGQGGPSFLDNDVVERGGIDLGTTGRLQLMAKLAEGTGLEVPQVAQQAMSMGQAMGLGLRGTAAGGGAPPAPDAYSNPTGNSNSNPPIATTCFQLSNMFDPSQETEPDWVEEIRDDVIEECMKHGKVLHVFVDENSEDHNVYVKCDSSDAAAKSVSALHGRYFAGKMITAAYVPVVNYHALFPDSTTASIPLKPSNR